jgi:hypothetical protein
MDSLPLLPPPTGAEAVPDARGINLWRADPWLRPLLGLYLPEGLLAHLVPHLDRMGALAGGRLDELAGIADRNPPVLQPRTRRGEDAAAIESIRPTGRWSGSPSASSGWRRCRTGPACWAGRRRCRPRRNTR